MHQVLIYKWEIPNVNWNNEDCDQYDDTFFEMIANDENELRSVLMSFDIIKNNENNKSLKNRRYL